LPESGVLTDAYVIGLDPSICSAAKHSPFAPRFQLHTKYTNTMAANENAPRAPESDAQERPESVDPAVEQSVFPGDTRAQEGPTMGVSSAQRC
jgi:hypothetical protein